MAAQLVSGQVQMSWSFQEQAPAGVLGSQTLTAAVPIASSNFNYANATGAALGVDTIYAARFSLASTTMTINLFTGLVDLFGNSISFARVREFIVTVLDTSPSHLLEVYSAASSGVAWLPPVANFLTAQPNGGGIRLWDPNSEGAGVGCLVTTGAGSITFNSVSNTVLFSVFIAGNTAV